MMTNSPSETFVYLSPAAFVQLVSDMRTAQKLYFKHRTQWALQESKRLEKEVDSWLRDWWTAST